MAIQNSNLPPSSVNEVIKILEDETIIRSNLKSVSYVYSWIEEYGRTRYVCRTVDAICRRVTSDSFVQSEPSKVTMVLCWSTECLYAPQIRLLQRLQFLSPSLRFPYYLIF
ncbi:hypothetical protein AVEN_158938-1 [Araneus ventricosus]|uniref:Uncharacterized protein n=1 Tax=Araneus ventricosus TaxID=182803 RepID=A0A4Y2B9C8_ARAVE|nr:hypothetical protein AVEN_158938-1 [Araneus ventricosus]